MSNNQKDREEVGGNAGNQRHPPHVTENAEGAPVQREHPAPGEIEPLPANASGRERVDPEEDGAQRIDPESAYEGRLDEDKEHPPTSRPD